MPRRVRWLIGCLLLAVWVAVAMMPGNPGVRAAPLADQPTNTGTPLPPTPTATRRPTDTPTSGPPPTATPTGQLPPETPTATPKHPPPNEGLNPTHTPTPAPTGDPSVHKSADPSSGFPGDKITFTITARNDASIPATNVEVDDSIPDVFEITGASTSQGSVDVSGQRVHAVIGTIPPGGTVTIQIATTIRAGAAPGPVDNVAILTTDTPGDNPDNNTSTTTVTIEGGGPPTPTPAPAPPARLPPTGDNGPALALLTLLAAAAVLAGLGLRSRRRTG